MPDKVIVTNLTALRDKYQAAGVAAIKKSVRELIAADKNRGFATVLVALDDAAAMKKLGAPAVKNAGDPKENKAAIDGVYRALEPDYLMLLGAIDVIPHQNLKNSMFSLKKDADDEKFAPSDLPYACDARYSQDVNKFTGPTRVVSRLPDLTGQDGNPRYLLSVLKTAINWKSSPRENYEKYLAISAEAWKKSTALSLRRTFNTDKDMQTTPTKNSLWRKNLINRRAHFINCHGADTVPNFFGQSEKDDDLMPVSHRAAFVEQAGNILEGTVVSAECCFGAQLYNPSVTGQMGMANAYLDRKAYGFFGSTNTAYGPESGNDQADLICQYFLQRLLSGASIGRAALEARQRFIEKSSPLSNMNQKTLAQFNVYGDPSIVPVAVPTSKLAGPKLTRIVTGSRGKSRGLASARALQDAASVERSERREKLHAKGAMLGKLQPTFKKRSTGPSKRILTEMYKMMGQLDFTPTDTLSFDVKTKARASRKARGLARGAARSRGVKKQQATAFHICFGVTKPARAKSLRTGVERSLRRARSGEARSFAPGAVKKYVVLEAKEVDGKIVSVSQAHSK